MNNYTQLISEELQARAKPFTVSYEVEKCAGRGYQVYLFLEHKVTGGGFTTKQLFAKGTGTVYRAFESATRCTDKGAEEVAQQHKERASEALRTYLDNVGYLQKKIGDRVTYNTMTLSHTIPWNDREEKNIGISGTWYVVGDYEIGTVTDTGYFYTRVLDWDDFLRLSIVEGDTITEERAKEIKEQAEKEKKDCEELNREYMRKAQEEEKREKEEKRATLQGKKDYLLLKLNYVDDSNLYTDYFSNKLDSVEVIGEYDTPIRDTFAGGRMDIWQLLRKAGTKVDNLKWKGWSRGSILTLKDKDYTGSGSYTAVSFIHKDKVDEYTLAKIKA